MPASSPDSFLEHLRHQIAETGPLTVAEFMAQALGHPEWGYYMTADPLGATGDFITAPEISQMFGELLGAWCVQLWMEQGCPPRVTLVELGPGRGTLMADALRGIAAYAPAFLKAASLHLVETSPVLRQKQAASLHFARPIVWHDRMEEVPDLEGVPVLILANEFFDALPVHQFVKTSTGWTERCVGWEPEGDCLCFTLAPPGHTSLVSVPERYDSVPDGTIIDLCPLGESVVAHLARRIAVNGGGALIIDYGHAAPVPTDTLQALRNHRYVPVLESPGRTDLTAHVDFGALAAAAGQAGAAVYGPISQSALLNGLGLKARAAILRRSAAQPQRAALDAAVYRLTSATAMGTLFKALALTPPQAPRPPAFEALTEVRSGEPPIPQST